MVIASWALDISVKERTEWELDIIMRFQNDYHFKKYHIVPFHSLKVHLTIQTTVKLSRTRHCPGSCTRVPLKYWTISLVPTPYSTIHSCVVGSGCYDTPQYFRNKRQIMYNLQDSLIPYPHSLMVSQTFSSSLLLHYLPILFIISQFPSYSETRDQLFPAW